MKKVLLLVSLLIIFTANIYAKTKIIYPNGNGLGDKAMVTVY